MVELRLAPAEPARERRTPGSSGVAGSGTASSATSGGRLLDRLGSGSGASPGTLGSAAACGWLGGLDVLALRGLRRRLAACGAEGLLLLALELGGVGAVLALQLDVLANRVVENAHRRTG